MMNRRERGALGETIAGAFLRLKGYEVLDTNRWVGRREIDIVARDGPFLVGVEVKLRRSDAFGRAAEAADRRKLGGVRRALQVLARDGGVTRKIRVDVVAIDIEPHNDTMTVRHYAGV